MIIRNKSKRYTVIPNHVFEDVNEARALGVLCYILSKPETFIVRLEHIKNKFGFGRDVMRDIMKYLASLGYAYLEKRPGKDGSQWIVTDTPFEFSDRLNSRPTENPTVGKPVGIISTDSLTNTDKEKEKNIKKDSAASSEASSLPSNSSSSSGEDLGDGGGNGDTSKALEEGSLARAHEDPSIDVSSFPGRTTMKHYDIANEAIKFYMDWVSRYPEKEKEIQRSVTVLKKNHRVTDLTASLMRQAKNGVTLDEMKAAIAWKCETQASYGFYRNLNGKTILKSKFGESVDQAVDGGWLVDSKFVDQTITVEQPEENLEDTSAYKQKMVHLMNRGMSMEEAKEFIEQYGV